MLQDGNERDRTCNYGTADKCFDMEKDDADYDRDNHLVIKVSGLTVRQD